MTAARAFREDSRAFVNLSIYEQRLHRSMKDALRQFKEQPSAANSEKLKWTMPSAFSKRSK